MSETISQEEVKRLEERQNKILSDLGNLDTRTSAIERKVVDEEDSKLGELNETDQGNVTFESVREAQNRVQEKLNEAQRQIDSNLPENLLELKNRQLRVISRLESLLTNGNIFSESQLEGNMQLLIDIDEQSYSNSVELLEQYKRSNKEFTAENLILELNKRHDNIQSSAKNLQSSVDNLAQNMGVKLPNNLEDVSNMLPTSENFEELKKRQENQISKLISLAKTIQNIASSNSINLPDVDIVNNLIEESRKRSTHVKNRTGSIHLEIPNLVTNEIRDHYPSKEEEKMREEDRKSPTPTSNVNNTNNEFPSLELQHKSSTVIEENELKSAGIVITSPSDVKEQAKKFKRRRQSLQIGVTDLKQIFGNMDNTNTGSVNDQVLKEAINKVRIGNKFDKKLPEFIESILNDVKDNNGNTNYNKLCELLLEPVHTNNLQTKESWNKFREELIGNIKLTNCVRILYLFDGWPKMFDINVDTFNNKIINLNTEYFVNFNDIKEYISKSLNDTLIFKQVRFGLLPLRQTKIQWKTITNNEDLNKLPLSFGKDGWPEVRLWFRSEGFLNKTGGRPFPKEI